MNFSCKILGLLLASLVLASCGGGGGDGGATSPPNSGTITLSATTTTLPTNTGNYLPHDHGPNQAELTITMRNANGSLMTGQTVSVSISPVQVAALSFLVQTGNPDFDQLYGTFPIPGTNGVATAWVNAGTVAGTAIVTASATDPTTSRTISASLTFTITSGVGTLPATVALVPTPSGIYLPSSGGVSASSIGATVRDGGGQFVPDPGSGNGGFDNIQFEIVGAANGATLSSNSVSGPSTGTTVTSHTVQGQATASLQAADTTAQGPLQIRATVDRADNNVSNGIQDPVSITTSVIVSDGKLYSIKITSPDTNAILVNSVSGDASGTSADPDGTYSLTVSALGLDRQQNPVLPGTPVRFGAIDEPVGLFDGGPTANRFLISGNDGNPAEGSTTFTAPTGHFRTAGGGAGPGDAIVVFGKTQHGAPLGNEDLESALTVGQVNSETNLTTTTPFNRNDTTGSLVDNGNVLPYIIGRGGHGNITASAETNELGVAHAELTYTVSTLGHIVAMWAQGDGIDNITHGSRRVTDAVELVYPGVAPAHIVAFPSPIPGNQSTSVTVCITDDNRSPIQGVRFSFQMTLSGGTGSIDGNGIAGQLDNVTGPDGCVDASVTTSGIPASSATGGVAGTISFGAGDADPASVDIVVALAFLSAAPSQVCASAATPGSITVSAFATSGEPAAGVPINGSCEPATILLTPASGITNADGQAFFQVVSPPAITGTCTFTTGTSGTLQATVQVGGSGGFSPPCP